jgi:hypothetical protein
VESESEGILGFSGKTALLILAVETAQLTVFEQYNKQKFF